MTVKCEITRNQYLNPALVEYWRITPTDTILRVAVGGQCIPF